jgi:thiaminase/transcriptional activator TenA
VSAAQPFGDLAWSSTAEVRAAIDTHPFLLGLRDGTLPRATFVGYLVQDAHYLVGYARALAACAAQATEIDDISFWAWSAHDAIVVERSLHEAQLADVPTVEASPTCTAYLSFLGATAGRGCYPVLAAALLPCFWIYQDVGLRLTEDLAPSGHPYQEWIATYGDPLFTAATERARNIVDKVAEDVSPDVRDGMNTAFATACRYEWMFFDAAWRGETWPAFGPTNGRATTTATTNDAIEADSHG